MLRDGLGAEAGLAPLALEMGVAVHLAQAGFQIDFTDLEGSAQFDMLATKDGIELEIDCKTASGDVGRAIPRRRAIELFGRIRPTLAPYLNTIVGGRAVHIVVPGPFHGRDAYMSAVAKLVTEAVAAGVGPKMDDVSEITITEFALEGGWDSKPQPPSHSELSASVGRLFGNSNVNAMAIHRPGTALLVVIESKRPDKVIDGVYRALKDSAERQFSGTRPALLAVRLTDITGENLKTLMAQDRNGLAAVAQRLFSSERRAHLRNVAFLARGGVSATPGTPSGLPGAVITDRGIAASFRRIGHPTANDPRLDVFPD
jgi:hypothetical protein